MDSQTLTNFPWTGSESWDVDVLVVGGGPAGLAALTRLRWMKTMNPTPLSVVLVNSGPLGGLAKLGNSILTGPSLAFPAGELVTRLKKDLATYPAPLINGKVVRVERNDALFTTTLADGSTITSLSVIMACGMLHLANIHSFWQKGVSATFGNLANIMAILHKELPAHTRPLILGGPHLAKLSETIFDLNPRTILLIDNDEQAESPNIIRGTLEHISGVDKDMTVTILTGQKKIEQKTDRIIVEFNSLELHRPSLPAGLAINEIGYLKNQPDEGLFYAGDCGGPPFSAVVALGEGTKAGLSAYRYVHERKYERPAPLFAYYGDDRVMGENTDDYRLQSSDIPAQLLDGCPKGVDPLLWQQIDGKTSLSILQETIKDVLAKTRELLAQRAITLCSQKDHT